MTKRPVRPLSLHHMSALGLTIREVIAAGNAGGATHLCLFVQQPADGGRMPAVTDAEVADIRTRLDDAGLGVLGITSFPMLPGIDPRDYAAGLDRGATLGATCANARIGNPDLGRAGEEFARFGALCAERGIRPCIEFTGYGRSTAMAEALAVIAQAGCGSITLDPLHIARTGVPIEDVEALPARQIGYVQLCDGPLQATVDDYTAEQGTNRLLPGDGEFPLRRLLSAIPADFPVSLEVPRQSLIDTGMSPFDVARDLVIRGRAWLEGA